MNPSTVYIAWKNVPEHPRKGRFLIRNGQVSHLKVIEGNAIVKETQIEQSEPTSLLIELGVELSDTAYGAFAPVISWSADSESFSFLPLAIPETQCIQVPDFGVVMGMDLGAVRATHAEGTTYADVLQRGDYPKGKEISWDTWAAQNKPIEEVSTALGVSRDNRMFIVNYWEDRISASLDLVCPEEICYWLGRVMLPYGRVYRSLDEEELPILHARQNGESFVIEDTLFATFIDRSLNEANLKGTPLEVAHYYNRSSTFPPGKKEEAGKLAAAYRPEGELVLFMRSVFTNHSDIPIVVPNRFPIPVLEGGIRQSPEDESLLSKDGISRVNGIPISIHHVNGKPAQSLQPCVLLAPGQSIVMDSVLSHTKTGLSKQALEILNKAGIAWDEKLEEARQFWREKLKRAAAVSLPEKRLMHFWNSGLLDLDLITYGENHHGSLLPKVGVYSPIGSESIPIIEFYDSVGWHTVAQRSLDCFLDLQWENGRINLFNHYDIETGAFLFVAGRHFAYTQNKEWAGRHKEKIKRAADYILRQRQMDDPSAPSYGLVSGTVADPKEKTTAFSLNAYNAAGIAATADLLEAIGDADAAQYRKAAGDYGIAYRRAYTRSFERSPLIPTASGRWVPSGSANVEALGLSMLGLRGEALFTHRSYTAFDALLGPMYGIFAGITEPEEIQTQWLLEVNYAQLNHSCIAESQPYYSRHPELHLLRDEREAFLNAFYSGLTALADRDTMKFWEHLYHVSYHKTYEEGWALMQLRRMLWLEHKETLRLLPGIPEAWLDSEEGIEINRGVSYFGSFSLRIKRSANGQSLDFEWEPHFHTVPENVYLYLPGVRLIDSETLQYDVQSGKIRLLNPAESVALKILKN